MRSLASPTASPPTETPFTTPKILCVDDDQSIRTMLEKVLTAESYEVLLAISGEEGVALAEQEDPDLILLDIGLPGIDGIETLRKIKKIAPQADAIMITAEGSIESAVAAMKAGARNYITKPFNTEELQLLIAETLETVRLRREVNVLRTAQRERIDIDNFVAESPGLKHVIRVAERIAESDTATVLIEGENWHRQRTHCPDDPLQGAQSRRSVYRHQLWGDSEGPRRVRTLWE